MTTVLYYPLDESISEKDSLEDKIYKCGANTGNLVWANAIKNHILYDELWNSEKKYVGDNIVIPMANDLNPYNCTLEVYKDRFIGTNSNVQITIMGLGAQLTEEFSTPKKLVDALPQERKRALNFFGEHSESLGIRGWITAECLDLIGIHNYRVIGCPSFYIYGDNPPKFEKDISAESVCISWGGDCKKEQYIKEFFRNNKNPGDALIMQSIEDLPKTLFEDSPILKRHVDKRYPNLEVDPLELFQYIKETGHMFFDEKSWDNFLQSGKFTMAIGCRFHGNMKAWQMGIPALWITHDSRTSELCEVMKLPSVSVGKAADFVTREQFAQNCVYDAEFYENYQDCYLQYKSFLAENNIIFR